MAFRLEKFSEQNQKDYLVKYWKLNGEKQDENAMMVKANKILDGIKNSINDREKELTGIPLQLNMLGDIYLNNYELHENLNLKSLFDEFLKKQFYKFQYEEKNNIDITNPQVKKALDKEFDSIMKKYENISIYSLLVLNKNND
jgi:hypothetical protein